MSVTNSILACIPTMQCTHRAFPIYPAPCSSFKKDDRNPLREDIAETFLTFLAQKYRSHRISNDNLTIFLRTVLMRNAYFDREISKSDLHLFESDNPKNGYYYLSTLFRGPNM